MPAAAIPHSAAASPSDFAATTGATKAALEPV